MTNRYFQTKGEYDMSILTPIYIPFSCDPTIFDVPLS